MIWSRLLNWFRKITFFSLTRMCFDKNWERLLGLNLLPVLLIFLCGILRNVFWILVSLNLGFGSVFWMMFSYFLARLNAFHESIKFTWEIGLQEIAFLDVWITNVNGAFQTDVYSKSTDAHQYLNFKSCHPPHVKRAIPYSQGLRLKRVCNSGSAFEKRLGELKSFLVKRGYCSDYVDNQFGRVREVNRNSLFKRKEGRNIVIEIVLWLITIQH